MRSILVAGLFAAMAFAGCISAEDIQPAAATDLSPPPGDLDLLGGKTRMSLAAHPAFGYPTPVDYAGFTGGAVPSMWVPPPAAEIPDVIRGIEFVARPEMGGGSGIVVFGHYVVMSGNPGAIIDIADPTNPVKVADIDVGTRDADVILYPDGRTVAVMASSGPIHVFDISDPTNPVQLPDLESRSHNAGVVPGTPIVYNANSAGGGITAESYAGAGTGKTEIYDLSDPENPVQLDTFNNGYGCHDITFFIDAANEKYRAYCAGIEYTQIWDIADPRKPEVIANIPVHHGVADSPSASVPLVLFSHLAMVSADGNILIVGDETGGGAAPGCDAGVNTPLGAKSGPAGNLWFYDISDESEPRLLSWVSPNPPASTTPMNGNAITCTAHFGRLIEDRPIVAMAFYGAGTVLVDFSDPMAPRIIDQWNQGTNTWDTWEWQGWLFTGDISAGVNVLKLV